MTETTLRARSLVKRYGATEALGGIDVDVRSGESVAVTGPSGSGKSTLLLCLAGILTPDEGEVDFGDRHVSREDEATRSRLRRREFGVVFQFGQLVPELTAEENVALPLLLDGVRRAQATSSAHDWLDRFEVGGMARARAGEMSGGQAQRVAIARAMVTGPRVLFADEPTGALDSLTSETVMAEIARVAAEEGTTLVLCSHDARVAAYADREIRMRDGRLDPAYVVVPAGSAS